MRGTAWSATGATPNTKRQVLWLEARSELEVEAHFARLQSIEMMGPAKCRADSSNGAGDDSTSADRLVDPEIHVLGLDGPMARECPLDAAAQGPGRHGLAAARSDEAGATAARRTGVIRGGV